MPDTSPPLSKQATSASYLQAVLDSAHNGIMGFVAIRDESNQIIDFEWTMVNRVAERIVGVEHQYLIGKRMLTELPGNKTDGLFDHYVQVVETDTVFDTEHYYAHDNIDTYFHITANKLDDGFVVSFTDITHHKKLQNELRHKFHELDYFFKVTPDLLCMFTLSGQFIKLNTAWEQTLGYRLHELEGSDFLDFLHPDDRAKTQKILKTSYEGSYYDGFRNRYRHKDGTYRLIEWNCYCDGELVYAAAEDITERAQNMTRLRQSEERFSAAFLNSPIPMCITTTDRDNPRFVEANQAYCDLIGFNWDDMKNKSLLELGLIDANYICHKRHDQLTENKYFKSSEFILINRNNVSRHVIATVQRYMIDNRELDLEILLDITEQKQAENRILEMAVEQARTTMLSDFIASSSHEFRTPLSIIQSSLYLMTQTDDETVRTQKADRIEQQITRINKLVDMLHKLSQLTYQQDVLQSKVSITDVIQYVTDKVQGLPKQGIATITYNLAPELPQIIANPQYLTDAIWEVVDNALQYTQAGDQIIISTSADDDYIIIKVNDTGEGIPDDKLPYIFDYFFRVDSARTSPGLGLGLVLSKIVVESYGGSISADSTLGEGTSIKMQIPIF